MVEKLSLESGLRTLVVHASFVNSFVYVYVDMYVCTLVNLLMYMHI